MCNTVYICIMLDFVSPIFQPKIGVSNIIQGILLNSYKFWDLARLCLYSTAHNFLPAEINRRLAQSASCKMISLQLVLLFYEFFICILIAV